MIITSQVQVKSTPVSSFTPVRPNLMLRKCACGGTPGPTGECAECRKKRLQRRSSGRAEFSPSAAPPIVHEVLRSPGRTLDSATREFMESRFGHEFGQVRVHTDTRAAESAQAVNALAYTVGRDVVFGAGQFAPREGKEQRLLAHELTHVVQQGHALALQRHTLASSSSPLEQEASRTADAVVGGRTLPTRSTTSPALQRQDAGEMGAPDAAGVAPTPALTSPPASAPAPATRGRVRTIAGDYDACLNEADNRQFWCQQRGNLLCSIAGARVGVRSPIGGAGTYGTCNAVYNAVCRREYRNDVAFCGRKRDCLIAGASARKPPSECGGGFVNWLTGGGTGDPWPDFDESRDTYAEWGSGSP